MKFETRRVATVMVSVAAAFTFTACSNATDDSNTGNSKGESSPPAADAEQFTDLTVEEANQNVLYNETYQEVTSRIDELSNVDNFPAPQHLMVTNCTPSIPDCTLSTYTVWGDASWRISKVVKTAGVEKGNVYVSKNGKMCMHEKTTIQEEQTNPWETDEKVASKKWVCDTTFPEEITTVGENIAAFIADTWRGKTPTSQWETMGGEGNVLVSLNPIKFDKLGDMNVLLYRSADTATNTSYLVLNDTERCMIVFEKETFAGCPTQSFDTLPPETAVLPEGK